MLTEEERRRAIFKGKLLIVGMALLVVYAVIRYFSS
jgi:hypothetical protein